ncbi:MAG: hypothetical protein WDA16_13775 [Candidatus Thermoplasmatota archaeon]
MPEPSPKYVLHAGFVSLDAPPIESAIANVGITAPRSVLAAWHWALPLAGLVGLGAVVMTARGLQGSAMVTMTRRNAPQGHATPQEPRVGLAGASMPTLLQAGKAAIDRGAISEGLAWFTQATLLDPTLHVAHYCRGLCLAALRQHEEAMDALGPLLEVLPALADDVANDDAFAGLGDHPRFLAMTGRL